MSPPNKDDVGTEGVDRGNCPRIEAGIPFVAGGRRHLAYPHSPCRIRGDIVVAHPREGGVHPQLAVGEKDQATWSFWLPVVRIKSGIGLPSRDCMDDCFGFSDYAHGKRFSGGGP